MPFPRKQIRLGILILALLLALPFDAFPVTNPQSGPAVLANPPAQNQLRALADGKPTGNLQSAGGGTYGIVGGVGNETTLETLYSLTQIKVPPTDFTKYYVSPAAGGDIPTEGDDANPGTLEQPFKTMSAAQGVVGAIGAGVCKVEVIFDSEDDVAGTDFNSNLTMFADCLTADEIGIYVHTTNPSNLVRIDGTGVTQAGAVFDCTGSAGVGWCLVEGFDVYNHDDGDGFDGHVSAMIMAVNSGATSLGGGNDIFSVHGDGGVGYFINTYGNAMFLGGNTPTVHNSLNESDTIVISNNLFTTDDGGASLIRGCSNQGGGGVEMLFIGPECKPGPTHTGQFWGFSQQNTSAGTDSKLTLARVLVHGHTTASSFGIVGRATGAGATSEIDLYQVTIGDGAGGIRRRQTDTLGNLTLTGRCVLMDELTSNHQLIQSSKSYGTYDLQYSIYDDDDSLNTYSYNSSNYTTWEDPGGIYSAVSDTWPNFYPSSNSYDSGGNGVDGVQWGVDPDYKCQPGKECYNACPAEYTISLPTALPSWVLGQEVTAFRLNSAGGHIGARW